jgi:hypothetical protein
MPRRFTRRIEDRLIRQAESRVQATIGRLAALQVELQQTEKRYERELARRSGRPAPPQHRPTLASASFEDLRGLGLSVNETSRFLASRHRGEVTTLPDIDAVPGLSKAVRSMLKRQLRD